MPVKKKTEATPEEVRLVVPSWERREIRLTIAGITPLLTNAIPEWVLEDIWRKQAGMTAIPREKRAPEQIAAEAKYVIDADAERYGFPTHGLRKAVARAGQEVGLHMTQVYKRIQVPDGYFEIKGSKPVISVMSARNRAGQIIPAIRPRWMPWEMDVEFSYAHPMITDEQVVNLVSLAGEVVGIGPARPERGMTYGRFEVREVR